MRFLRHLAVSCLFLAFLVVPSAKSKAQGTIFTVSNINDSGDGSLRQAILDTNNSTGKDTIKFNISLFSTINLLTPLPDLTDADGTIIDAFPDGNSVCADKMIISGENASVSYGLRLVSSNNIIQGLNFQGFQTTGVYITTTSNSNALYCNLFEKNLASGLRIEGSYNVIGASNPPLPNALKNNPTENILISGLSAQFNVLQGNVVGISATSTGAQNAVGVQVEQGASDNFIGSNADAVSDASEGNFFYGNTVAAIVLTDLGTTNNRVSSNRIGYITTEQANGIGILVKNGAQNNIIGTSGDFGFPSRLANTIISNTGYGVKITDAGTTGNQISGNLIGMRASPEFATYGNGGGIEVANGAQNTIIGSNQDGLGDSTEANIIASNTTAGIHVTGTGTTNTKIVGNLIGIDWNGYFKANFKGVYLEAPNVTLNTLILNNVIGGGFQEGILLSGANGNTLKGNYIGTNLSGTSSIGINLGALKLVNSGSNVIGGTTSTEANIIGGVGVQIGASCAGDVMVTLSGLGTQNNTIQGNYIGISKSGTALNCANATAMLITNASNNLIGGTVTGTRNVIGFVASGINISGSSTNNRLLGNLIYNVSNSLAIDLGVDGVTPNDPGDVDSGPNGRQNTLEWETVSHTLTSATSATIYVRLNSTANTTFRAEFYFSDFCETNTGRGDAKQYAGSTDITTDGTGNITFSTELTNIPLADKPYLVATVTGPSGTSEFAPCIRLGRVIVTNVNDSGGGSFRRALEISNALSIARTIEFAIPGTGVKEITLLSPLPVLTALYSDRVFINGLSQTGATCATPKIAIQKGYAATSDGLTILGSYDIEGLIIGGFTDGYGINLIGSANIIACNFLGTTSDGGAANPNRVGLYSQGHDEQFNNNVMSGNLEQGVLLQAAGTTWFRSNRIGVDVTGMFAVPNGMEGIYAEGADIRIVEDNVISGNKGDGVFFAPLSETSTIYGSVVGLNAAGTAAIPNEGNGVRVQGYHIWVGESNLGSPRINVISGNLLNGILIETTNNYVDGTMIGTNKLATAALGNGLNGILVLGNYNQIGYGDPTNNHVTFVGGNALDGIVLSGIGNTVTGATIGLNAAGTVAIGNGQNGIRVSGNDSQITLNTISGNTQAGIADYASNTSITSNIIGVNKAKTLAIPNAQGIIFFAPTIALNAVTSVSNNVIAWNTGVGVAVAAPTRKRVRIFDNSIYANGGLGIDLGADGVTPNDPSDLDNGVNGLLNSPILQRFDGIGGTIKVVGILNSQPSANYTLRLYGNAACDATSYGEGQFSSIAPATTLTTDGAGNVNFVVTLDVNTYHIITATVEDAEGNTSEFSNCISLRADTIGIYRPSGNTFYLRNSNSTGFADITVSLVSLGMNPNAPFKDIPVVGDWNNDGIDTVGFYRSSTGEFVLSDSNISPHTDHYLVLGSPNDTPLIGDWDGDGTDGVGVFRPSNGLIYLKNQLTTGFADYTMVLGIPGDVGLAGDWNNDGKDSPGVYRPSNGLFYLTDQICNCQVYADYYTALGILGDQPFLGDWNGDGRTGLGVFRPTNGLTYLRNDPTTSGFADLSFVFGIPNDIAFAGVWSDIGTGTPAGVIPAPTFVPSK